MDKFVNKTVDALTRFGERIERHMTVDEDDVPFRPRLGSDSMVVGNGSAFRRPLDKKRDRNYVSSSKRRDLVYGGARNQSSDNLAASPGHGSFSNYRQNPMQNSYADEDRRRPYGTGIGAPLQYSSNNMAAQNFGGFSGGYGNPSAMMPYAGQQGSVGYAPDYYIAERRQLELVPAPRPQIIRQQVPVPYPVDRPVPQPYPVEVIRQVPVDRPYPVAVPVAVPVDRPVAVPVPVPVPSPPPPPVCIQVPVAVPTPVPCYVPVGVPVPSPPPSPVMYEQSVTHSQRWVTGSPAMLNRSGSFGGSPLMMNQPNNYVSSSAVMNQPNNYGGAPMMFGGQPGYYSSPSVMNMNPYGSYGSGYFVR